MASGAASNSPRNFASARLRSVISRMALDTSTPSAVSNGLRLISIGNSLPSLCKPYNSRPAPMGRTRGSAKKPSLCAGCCPRNLPGTSISIGFCKSSSRRYPNNFSTCALTRTMFPSRFTTTMASGAASNSPRNLCSACLRSAISFSSALLISCNRDGLGRVNALGTSCNSSSAVVTDTNAVIALIRPDTR